MSSKIINTSDQTETAWQPDKNPVSAMHMPHAQAISKPLKPLTRKQAAFVQELVNNPKQSATQAVLKTYNIKNPVTAATVGTENLRKPNIMLELEKYSKNAELVLIRTMNRSEQMMMSDAGRAVDWANTARQTADSILDRLHGKATQRLESQSTTVTLNVDLTGLTDTDSNNDNTPTGGSLLKK